MAYYRVVLQQVLTWQVLVTASDEVEAKEKAKDVTDDDGLIADEISIYDITELEIKK